MTRTIRVFERGSVFMDIFLENTPQNVICGNGDADICVVMPEFCGAPSGNYGILLLPYEFENCAVARNVITYGMSPVSTVTMSSVGENRCVLTVQREITTMWGDVIEPQDIVVPRMHLAPHYALAASAALLIMGGDIGI